MANIIEACDIQVGIDEVFSCDLNADYSAQIPVTGVIKNNVATQKLTTQLQGQNGQETSVRISWDNEFCGTVNDGCPTSFCDSTGTPVGQGSVVITNNACDTDIAGHLSIKFTLDEYRKAMATGVSGPFASSHKPNKVGTQFEREVYKMMKALDIQAEKKLAQQIVNAVNPTTFGFSSIEGLTAPKEVKTFGAISGGSVTYNDLAFEVAESAQLVNFCSSPILIGGRGLNQYMQFMGNGCCVNGFDIAQYMDSNQFGFIRSQEIQNLIGADQFLSVELGAMQIINWNKFKGDFGWNVGTSEASVIFSPVSGRAYDFRQEFITCDSFGYIVVTLAYSERLVTLPDTLCNNDHRKGANGIQQFKIVN